MTHDDSLAKVTVAPWLYAIVVPLQRLLMSLYFSRIVIQGFEHLPINGPVILAPKHYSRWDPLALALLSVEPLWFMTNANQFEGIQGWLLQRLGAFPVDLAHPKVSSYRYAIHLLKARKKLMLFPEGGIVRDQLLRPIKPGLARLTLQAEAALGGEKIPVVPIAISYSPDALFRSGITIRITPPLYAADYQQENDKQTAVAFTEALQTALIEALEQIKTSPQKY